MSEKINNQQENPQVIRAETIPSEGIHIRPHEVVYVSSDFSDQTTIFLGPLRRPGKFSRIAIIRLGNESVYNDIGILAAPGDDGLYESPAFYAYAIEPKRPDQLPVPFFNITEEGLGVIGKKSKPDRDYTSTVSYKHVRVFNEGALLGIENLEPQYSTTLMRIEPLGQQSFPNLTPEIINPT